MQASNDASPEPYSYVHRGTEVEGRIVSDGRLRIDGTVNGEVRAAGVLEIAPGGRVEGGPVRATDVRVAGIVVGEVHAEGKVEIWRDAEVRGDVHAATLDVEEGARFSGRSFMAGDEPAADASEGAPAEAVGRAEPAAGSGGDDPVPAPEEARS
ncbi:MAG: polymer-forming cytoskeletal protein [Trueperaceae bacterium]|nr:polymer-forming cytoskeletal protein [Trueperaceae bacterium]